LKADRWAPGGTCRLAARKAKKVPRAQARARARSVPCHAQKVDLNHQRVRKVLRVPRRKPKRRLQAVTSAPNLTEVDHHHQVASQRAHARARSVPCHARKVIAGETAIGVTEAAAIEIATETEAVVIEIATETEEVEIVIGIEADLAVVIEATETEEVIEIEGIVMSEIAIAKETATEIAEIADLDQGDPEGHLDEAALAVEIIEIEEEMDETWTNAVTAIETAPRAAEAQRLHGLQRWNRSRGGVYAAEAAARAAAEAPAPAVLLRACRASKTRMVMS